MYSSQISQDHRSSKDQLATSATSATSKSQAVLGEFDRLRERRVPGDNLDSGDRSEISGEEHVAIMEKDLRDDAPWKRIQRNTFTRWVNEHLKKAEESIESLQADLSDGLRLITLIEVLSGKKLPKHTKRPTFRSQKLENVSVALTFLEEEEGIKLVSIGQFLYFSSKSRHFTTEMDGSTAMIRVDFLNFSFVFRQCGYCGWPSEADSRTYLGVDSALLHLPTQVG
jgi:Calponin homology (CH) domain